MSSVTMLSQAGMSEADAVAFVEQLRAVVSPDKPFLYPPGQLGPTHDRWLMPNPYRTGPDGDEELDPVMEIQRDYNKWRSHQDCEKILRQVLLDLVNPQDTLHQSPSPSPSQVTTGSTPGLLDLDHGETWMESTPPKKRKKTQGTGKCRGNGRGGRTGPLEEENKLRTAFMRKKGACSTCRARKVLCEHYDVNRWEPYYLRWKDWRSQLADAAVESMRGHTFNESPGLSHSLPATSFSGFSDHGDGSYSASGTWKPDPEIMPSRTYTAMEHLPEQTLAWSTPRTYTTRSQSIAAVSDFSFVDPVLDPPQSLLASSAMHSGHEDVAIGFEVQSIHGLGWKCFFSSPRTSKGPTTCMDIFDSLDQLKAHCRSQHRPCIEHVSPFRGYCAHCTRTWDWNLSPGRCPRCDPRRKPAVYKHFHAWVPHISAETPGPSLSYAQPLAADFRYTEGYADGRLSEPISTTSLDWMSNEDVIDVAKVNGDLLDWNQASWTTVDWTQSQSQPYVAQQSYHIAGQMRRE